MEFNGLEELAMSLSREFGIELQGKDYAEGESEALNLRISYSKNGNPETYFGKNIHLTKEHPLVKSDETIVIERIRIIDFSLSKSAGNNNRRLLEEAGYELYESEDGCSFDIGYDGFEVSYITLCSELAILRFASCDAKRHDDPLLYKLKGSLDGLLMSCQRAEAKRAAQSLVSSTKYKNYRPMVTESFSYRSLGEMKSLIDFFVSEFKKPPYTDFDCTVLHQN